MDPHEACRFFVTGRSQALCFVLDAANIHRDDRVHSTHRDVEGNTGVL
jgi:hypothetical protein